MTMNAEDAEVKRMTVSMDDELYEKVEKIAIEQERTVPNLLVYLARLAVKEQEEKEAGQ